LEDYMSWAQADEFHTTNTAHFVVTSFRHWVEKIKLNHSVSDNKSQDLDLNSLYQLVVNAEHIFTAAILVVPSEVAMGEETPCLDGAPPSRSGTPPPPFTTTITFPIFTTNRPPTDHIAARRAKHAAAIHGCLLFTKAD
jgi:hypothetical protein